MDLFELFGTISIKNSDAIKALDETSQAGEKAQSKLGSAMSGIGKGAAVVGKAVATGLVAAGTAVGGLVAQSTSAYAEYEQLVGGVDTLFKNSSSKVQGYAEKAYETAGMSANEYMNTVTSFSASLLQSLGGDTDKAADKADMAIRDMSDNANKMGTSMESIQNAYQGFAKQNYTMLDNLKLGYGGTKEEMERLLADAEKLSGKKFDISSYADVVDAIHVVQTEMGITGTTASEAAGTISGSMASVKGAWANLVTAMASDDLPLDEYINKFVNSASTMVSNMLPRIQQALTGAVQLVNQLAPVIIGKIPELFSQLLPSIIQAATGLIDSIAGILPDLIGMLTTSVLPQFLSSVVTIVNSLISALPSLMQSICSALPTLIPLLINGLVSMIVTLCTNFSAIIQPIIDILPELIISVVNALLSNLPALIGGLIQLVIGIAQALPQILSGLWTALTTLCSQATSKLFGKIGEWIRTLFPKSANNIFKVLETIKSAFQTWISNIKAIFSVVVTVISTPFKLAWNGIKLVWNNAVAFFKMIWNNIKVIFSVVDSVLSGDFKGAWEGIKKIWSNVTGFFKQVVSNVKNAFSNVGEILTAPFRKAKDAIKKIVDNIKGFFTGLKLKFPNIKLPHFKIKPSGWKIGDLLEGSIPKLGIEWYAKGGIMKEPTLFDYNPATGRARVGGEAGDEAIAPIDTLQQYVKAAVQSENTTMVSKLDRIINLLVQFFPEMLEALDIQMYLNGEVLVAETANAMDVALGKIAIKKGRGR